MKICTKCLIEKQEIDFPVNKAYKCGYNSRCKSCQNRINKIFRDANSEAFKKARKLYYQRNLSKMRKLKKDYYSLHKAEKHKYDVEYRKINSKKIKEYKKAWESESRNIPIFKIKNLLRSRVRGALKGNPKSDKTFDLLGFDPEQFKVHIEQQFQEGMSWSNHGKWHIDHIIPCFKFNLLLEEEQRKCFHFSNQRPLWAEDNLRRPRNI